jgi:hypothetical protein
VKEATGQNNFVFTGQLTSLLAKARDLFHLLFNGPRRMNHSGRVACQLCGSKLPSRKILFLSNNPVMLSTSGHAVGHFIEFHIAARSIQT